MLKAPAEVLKCQQVPKMWYSWHIMWGVTEKETLGEITKMSKQTVKC